jgi:SAM-dependent methyltransferase
MKQGKRVRLPQEFQFKTFFRLDSFQTVIDFVNKYRISPKTGHKIDGAIVQDISKPYFSQSTYKLKRLSLNTIDFFVKYNPQKKLFYLFLQNFDNRNLFRELPQESFGIDTYKLFLTPFFEDTFFFIPRRKWSVPKDLFEEEITEVNSLMESIINNPQSYDSKIIEFSYALDGFVPFRIRTDKQKSNAYLTGLSTLSTIFSPLSVSSSYFNKKSFFSKEVIDVFHQFSKTFRDCLMNFIPSCNSVIDLAGGRGGDLIQLINKGVKNIFAIDCDREALVQYVDRAIKNNCDCKLSVIPFLLNTDNRSLIEDVRSRAEFPKEGVDMILMNFAIHYLCDSESKIKALGDIFKLLRRDGIFVCSFYCGDEILNDLTIKYKRSPSKGDVLVLKSFNISVVEVNESITCSMPLPTIDASGYRNEPLAMLRMLHLLPYSMSNSINVFSNFEPFFKNIHNIDLIEDYIKYIRISVYTKTD